jgi:hypothetical protein
MGAIHGCWSGVSQEDDDEAQMETLLTQSAAPLELLLYALTSPQWEGVSTAMAIQARPGRKSVSVCLFSALRMPFPKALVRVVVS